MLSSPFRGRPGCFRRGRAQARRLAPAAVAAPNAPDAAPRPTVAARGKAHLYHYDLPAGALCVGVEHLATPTRPGNGGLRIMQYHSVQDAAEECTALTCAMNDKHAVYNTGFSGAKLVLAAAAPPHELDRAQLMRDVADVLAQHGGVVYTGCDVNSSGEDMVNLSEMSPYVLASIGCPTDANDATAHGVYAAVTATLEHLRATATPRRSPESAAPSPAAAAAAATGSAAKGKRVLVKGLGKVGSTVARLLVADGATVFTYDIAKERADIPGATNVSGQDWASFDCDVLVPCSTSRFIDNACVERMRCAAVVGSANVPFKNGAALAAAEARGILYVAESVSSAGAVLADSIEHYAADAYRCCRPSIVYAFIRSLVHDKTAQLLRLAAARGTLPSRIVDAVKPEAGSPTVGRRFLPWLQSATESFDTVVIGGGMAGTAAAYWLAREAPGQRGVVLEAGEGVAHVGGSSHGASRMYRQMYSSKYFSQMQEAALPMWREIERSAGVKLLTQNGLLFYGETDTGETVEGSIPESKKVMDARGIGHEHFKSGEELQARYPEMVAGPEHEGLLEHGAGSIDASGACAAMMGLAQRSGDWELRANTRVEDVFVAGPGRVVVVTSGGAVLQAHRAVVAAGAWTNDVLAHLGCQLDLEVWRVHWGHYEVTPQAAAALPQWFYFGKDKGDDSWDGGLYYGFPLQPDEQQQHASSAPAAASDSHTAAAANNNNSNSDHSQQGAKAAPPPAPVKLKVGVDFTPPPHRGTSMQGFDYQPDPKVASLIDAFVKQRWSGYVRQADMQASPYTMTRDSKFVLGALPGAPEVVVFTGGSGRAFKFGPLLGRCLADLALGRTPSFDVSPLAVDRPEAGLKSVAPPYQGGLPAFGEQALEAAGSRKQQQQQQQQQLFA